MRQLQNTVASQEYIVSERINELGEKVLTTSANAFNASELKILKTIDSRYNALEDHLKANNRKIKDLQSSISFNVSASGEQIAKVDTIIRNKIVDNYFPTIPGWRYTDGVISINSTLRSDSTLFQSYQLQNLKFTVDVFAKNRFLKKPQFFADVTSINPGVNISNSDAFIKKHPKAFLTFAAGIGGTLTPDLKIEPGIQIGIYKPIYTIYK